MRGTKKVPEWPSVESQSLQEAIQTREMAIPNNFNNVSSEDSKGRMGTDCKQESDTSSPTEESQAEVGEVKISSRRNRRRREQYSLGKRSYQKIVKTESHRIGKL